MIAPRLCKQPQALPIILSEALAPERARAIRVIKKKWVNGTVLHYCFLTSDKWSWPKEQMDVVRWAFKTWKDLDIGLKFVETTDVTEAEIRIGAMQNDGSWSYIGTDILQYQDLGRTMNYGWDLTTKWGHATALHEIGHTLGLPHEHQNPAAGIVWNEPKVYAYFSGSPRQLGPRYNHLQHHKQVAGSRRRGIKMGSAIDHALSLRARSDHGPQAV